MKQVIRNRIVSWLLSLSMLLSLCTPLASATYAHDAYGTAVIDVQKGNTFPVITTYFENLRAFENPHFSFRILSPQVSHALSEIESTVTSMANVHVAQAIEEIPGSNFSIDQVFRDKYYTTVSYVETREMQTNPVVTEVEHLDEMKWFVGIPGLPELENQPGMHWIFAFVMGTSKTDAWAMLNLLEGGNVATTDYTWDLGDGEFTAESLAGTSVVKDTFYQYKYLTSTDLPFVTNEGTDEEPNWVDGVKAPGGKAFKGWARVQTDENGAPVKDEETGDYIYISDDPEDLGTQVVTEPEIVKFEPIPNDDVGGIVDKEGNDLLNTPEGVVQQVPGTGGLGHEKGKYLTRDNTKVRDDVRYYVAVYEPVGMELNSGRVDEDGKAIWTAEHKNATAYFVDGVEDMDEVPFLFESGYTNPDAVEPDVSPVSLIWSEGAAEMDPTMVGVPEGDHTYTYEVLEVTPDEKPNPDAAADAADTITYRLPEDTTVYTVTAGTVFASDVPVTFTGGGALKLKVIGTPAREKADGSPLWSEDTFPPLENGKLDGTEGDLPFVLEIKPLAAWDILWKVKDEEGIPVEGARPDNENHTYKQVADTVILTIPEDPEAEEGYRFVGWEYELTADTTGVVAPKKEYDALGEEQKYRTEELPEDPDAETEIVFTAKFEKLVMDPTADDDLAMVNRDYILLDAFKPNGELTVPDGYSGLAWLDKLLSEGGVQVEDEEGNPLYVSNGEGKPTYTFTVTGVTLKEGEDGTIADMGVAKDTVFTYDGTAASVTITPKKLGAINFRVTVTPDRTKWPDAETWPEVYKDFIITVDNALANITWETRGFKGEGVDYPYPDGAFQDYTPGDTVTVQSQGDILLVPGQELENPAIREPVASGWKFSHWEYWIDNDTVITVIAQGDEAERTKVPMGESEGDVEIDITYYAVYVPDAMIPENKTATAVENKAYEFPLPDFTWFTSEKKVEDNADTTDRDESFDGIVTFVPVPSATMDVDGTELTYATTAGVMDGDTVLATDGSMTYTWKYDESAEGGYTADTMTPVLKNVAEAENYYVVFEVIGDLAGSVNWPAGEGWTVVTKETENGEARYLILEVVRQERDIIWKANGHGTFDETLSEKTSTGQYQGDTIDMTDAETLEVEDGWVLVGWFEKDGANDEWGREVVEKLPTTFPEGKSEADYITVVPIYEGEEDPIPAVPFYAQYRQLDMKVKDVTDAKAVQGREFTFGSKLSEQALAWYDPINEYLTGDDVTILGRDAFSFKPVASVKLPNAAGVEVEYTTTAGITDNGTAIPLDGTKTYGIEDKLTPKLPEDLAEGTLVFEVTGVPDGEWLDKTTNTSWKVINGYLVITVTKATATVIWDADNKGTFGGTDTTLTHADAYQGDKVTMPEDVDMNKSFEANEGYIFKGWYTEKNGGGTEVTAETTTVPTFNDGETAEVTYYAHYKQDTMEADFSTKDKAAIHEQAFTLPVPNVKWTEEKETVTDFDGKLTFTLVDDDGTQDNVTDKNITGVNGTYEYDFANPADNKFTPVLPDGTATGKLVFKVTGDLTASANWPAGDSWIFKDGYLIITVNKALVDIEWVIDPADGATFTDASKKLEEKQGEQATITLPTYQIEEGWLFKGWFDKQNGEGNEITKDTTVPGDGDSNTPTDKQVYYGHFEKDTVKVIVDNTNPDDPKTSMEMEGTTFGGVTVPVPTLDWVTEGTEAKPEATGNANSGTPTYTYTVESVSPDTVGDSMGVKAGDSLYVDPETGKVYTDAGKTNEFKPQAPGDIVITVTATPDQTKWPGWTMDENGKGTITITVADAPATILWNTTTAAGGLTDGTHHTTTDAKQGYAVEALPTTDPTGADGWLFEKWVDSDGKEVKANETCVPVFGEGETAEVTYTAQFKKDTMQVVTDEAPVEGNTFHGVTVPVPTLGWTDEETKGNANSGTPTYTYTVESVSPDTVGDSMGVKAGDSLYVDPETGKVYTDAGKTNEFKPQAPGNIVITVTATPDQTKWPGWTVDENGNGSITIDVTTATSEITWNADGKGTFDPALTDEDTTQKQGDTLKVPTVKPNEGYLFDRWTDSTGGELPGTVPLEDTSYTATYTKKDMAIDVNGNDAQGKVVHVIAGEPLTNEAIGFHPNTGLVWADENGDPTETAVSGDHTYKYEYSADGGTTWTQVDSFDQVPSNEGTVQVKITATPADSWNDGTEGDTSGNWPETVETIVTVNFTSDYVLKWDANGGKFADGSTATETIQLIEDGAALKATNIPADPTTMPEGYGAFDGWYVADADGNPTDKNVEAGMALNDKAITFVAKYKDSKEMSVDGTDVNKEDDGTTEKVGVAKDPYKLGDAELTWSDGTPVSGTHEYTYTITGTNPDGTPFKETVVVDQNNPGPVEFTPPAGGDYTVSVNVKPDPSWVDKGFPSEVVLQPTVTVKVDPIKVEVSGDKIGSTADPVEQVKWGNAAEIDPPAINYTGKNGSQSDSTLTPGEGNFTDFTPTFAIDPDSLPASMKNPDGSIKKDSTGKPLVSVDPATGKVTLSAEIPAGAAGTEIKVNVTLTDTSGKIYEFTNQEDAYFTVEITDKDPQTLTWTVAPENGETSINETPAFTAAASSNWAPAGGNITYSSSNPAVAYVDPITGEVVFLKPGTVTITATAEGDDNYSKASISKTVTVSPREVYFQAEGVKTYDNSSSFTTGMNDVTWNLETFAIYSADNGTQITKVPVTANARARAVGVTWAEIPADLTAIDLQGTMKDKKATVGNGENGGDLAGHAATKLSGYQLTLNGGILEKDFFKLASIEKHNVKVEVRKAPLTLDLVKDASVKVNDQLPVDKIIKATGFQGDDTLKNVFDGYVVLTNNHTFKDAVDRRDSLTIYITLPDTQTNITGQAGTYETLMKFIVNGLFNYDFKWAGGIKVNEDGTVATTITVYTPSSSSSGGSSATSSIQVEFRPTDADVTLNGGTDSIWVSVSMGETLRADQLPKAEHATPGYLFVGWSTDPEGNRMLDPTKTSIMYSGVVYYPQFKKSCAPYAIGRTDDGSFIYFAPLDSLRRGEAVQLLSNLTNGYAKGQIYGDIRFPDIRGDAWHASAISFGLQKGYIQGCDDGTIQPDRSVTRAELATMIARFHDLTENSDISMFSDIEGHWAAGYIAALAEYGLVKGYGGLFRPDDEITRAEAVTMLNSMMDRDPMDRSYIFELTNPYTDVFVGEWYYTQVIEATVEHFHPVYGNRNVVEMILKGKEQKAKANVPSPVETDAAP